MNKQLSNTIPALWYSDNEIFQIERNEIFKKQWLYVADDNEFKNIGDYLNLEMAGYPFIIIKKSENEFVGFHNFCIHRAAPLLTEKKGNLKNSHLTCRYHGWSYNFQGELISAPLLDINIIKENCSAKLHEIQIGKINNLIFVNLNFANCDKFTDFISPVSQELQLKKYDLQKFKIFGQLEIIGNFNWKTWVDGFQECYHCLTIHPIFNRDFYLKNYQIDNKNNYSVHSCERKKSSQSGSSEGFWLWLFPNFGLPCYENGYYTLQINPLSPKQTKLSYKFRFKETEAENERVEFIKFVEKITIEDIAICEQVQKNLEVGIFQEGLLNPEKENGTAYFHSLVKKAISNAKEFPYGKKTI